MSTNNPHELRIALIGDFDAAITAHQAIPLALSAAAGALATQATWKWMHSSLLTADPAKQLAGFDAVWCVPGSPYMNTHGVLEAIRFARTAGRPFLGTCGGFQHALLEYAGAVWNVHRPAHAETSPEAEDPVITPLECALVEARDTIHFVAGSRLQGIYGVSTTTEEYRCRYGLSPRYAARLESGPMQVAARDDRGGVIAVELTTHPFFIAVLFQPERAALRGEIPPLVSAFLTAAI